MGKSCWTVHVSPNHDLDQAWIYCFKTKEEAVRKFLDSVPHSKTTETVYRSKENPNNIIAIQTLDGIHILDDDAIVPIERGQENTKVSTQLYIRLNRQE